MRTNIQPKREHMQTVLSPRLAIAALIVVLCIACGADAVQGECVQYNGRLCSNYISSNVFVTRPIEETENELAKLLAPFVVTGSELASLPCSEAYAAFVCGLYFMECKQDPQSDTGYSMLPPCQQTCTNATQQCAPLRNSKVPGTMPAEAVKLFNSMPLSNCNGTVGNGMDVNLRLNNTSYTEDTTKCALVEKETQRPVCLDPLIIDPDFPNNKSRVDAFCENGCCVPCPQSYVMYKKDQLESGFLATQLLRTISAVASFIMILSYLALPGKQSHPSILILFTSIAIFMYSANVFFSLGNPRRIQCVDDVTPSTQENNALCGIQGALLIFSAHATTIWLAVVIFNLHMHTVWNSSILSTNYLYIHILCWGLPTLLTIVPLATHKIKYQFATLCLVDQALGNELFWYPLAIVVLPSFFVHGYTFFHIAKVSTEISTARSESASTLSEFTSHRHQVMQAIRIQWRALLLALILLICVTWYWLFYFIELGRITHMSKTTATVTNWIRCVQSGGGQNGCAEVSAKFMPPLGLLITSETVVSLLGVYLLVIFSNRTLWTEWAHWFRQRFRKKIKPDLPDRLYGV